MGELLRRCARAGCPGKIRRDRDHTHCSQICQKVTTDLAYAERLAAAIGGAPALLGAGRELNAAYSVYKTEFERAYQAAREVGLSNEQWRTLLRGTAT